MDFTSEAVRREYALGLDAKDELASFRSHFFKPEGKTYFDGNSLGLMSDEAEKSLHALSQMWKKLGINGWYAEKDNWFTYAEDTGNLMCELIGAQPGEIVACGRTTTNIHAALSSFYRPHAGRNKILTDRSNFPSDLYALHSHVKTRGLDPAEVLVQVEADTEGFMSEEEIISHMSEEVCLVFLPSVYYHTAQLLDMERLSREAHKRGILIGFDCSHSAGVVDHQLHAWGIDFAVWCGYKYLNGGPGSSAFFFLHEKHFGTEPLMAGWFGSRKDIQFQMDTRFTWEKTAGGFQVSTPNLLSMAPLKGSLGISNAAGIRSLRAKSENMVAYLEYLVGQRLSAHGFYSGTPAVPHRRGGHLALRRRNDAAKIYAALEKEGFIGDFRHPDIIRIAPVPLYNTFEEIWLLVNTLENILKQGRF